MQKTIRFQRLLAVLVAVLLAVCSLPVSAFAEEQKVAVELDVHYRLDIRQLNDQTISLGELPYQPGAALTGRYSWETLYGKMNLPADTKIKDKQTGETELTFSLKEDGKPWKAELTVELASTIQHPSFRVRFEGVEEPQSVGVSLSYRPGRSVDAWSFLQNMTAYKTYQEQGYRIKGFTVSGDDHAPYTEADHYGLTDAIAGKTVVVTLGKEPENKTVDFTLRYLSTDNQIQDTQPATLTYRPDEAGTDLWDFVLAQDAYKTYEAQGYKMEDYVIPAAGGERLCDRQGLQNVNADLEGKEIIVHLVKQTEAKAEQVPFRLHYLSTDGSISDEKSVEVPYDPNGKSYDLWSYIEDSRIYKAYQKDGYTLKNFVVPHLDGNKTYTAAGQFTVTPVLKGAIVTVTLDKTVVSTKKTVDFTLQYMSNDKILDTTKRVSAQYDPEGELTDLWDYLKDTGTVQAAVKSGYTLQDYVLDEHTIQKAGVYAVNGDLAGKTVVVHLYKAPVSTKKTVDFTLQYMSNDKVLDATKQVSAQYDPEGVLTDLWDYLKETGTVKAAINSGYTLQDYVLDNNTYKTGGIQAVNGDLAGKTVVVHLYKAPVSTKKTVDFTLQYMSNDKVLDATKQVSAQYDPEGVLTDLWDYLKDTGTVQAAVKSGYTLQDYVLNNNTYKTGGIQAVNGDLAGKTVVVHLYKEPVSPNKTVDFTLRYLSTDNQIQKSQAISLVYDPNGELTDVWDFVMAQEPYKTYAAQDYTLSDYVIPAQGNDRVCEHCGMQAVTTDLQGKEIVVHLVKKSTAKTEMVDFTLRFLSDDGKIDVTKQASVTYDPNTKGFDAWNYLDGTATARSYGKDGYHIRDFTVSQPAGEASYTAAGQFTVTPALAGKTVTVHLAPPPAHYESSYIVHFVDEQGKEFQSAATVKVSWTEGQQLNLMAQLKDTLAAVGAKGYTFKTLTGWNGTNVYKGTELVVPGSWELTAHCVKNPAPAKPAENKPAQTKAKPAAQQVVKAAAPAANTTKILPKTGLQAQTPVVFGVMLFAALAGAAVYLFALRKKLN